MKKRTIAGIGLIAGTVVAARRFSLREDIDWAEAPKPGVIVDVDGYGVHYVEQGQGPAIVLVHGFGGHTRSYRALMPLLAQGHRVIAVDLKGFGYSQRDVHAGLSHTDQAEMLHRFLAHLGETSAIFSGHSMGGAVVQRLAVSHPESVEALVLISSVSGEQRVRRGVPVRALRPLLPLLGALVASRLLKASFHDKSLVTAQLRDEYLRPSRIRGSMDGLLAMIQDAARDEAIDRSRITQPCLMLWGAEDPVVPLKVAQELRVELPHARLVVVADASHLVMEERPAECAGAILDFIADAQPASQRPA